MTINPILIPIIAVTLGTSIPIIAIYFNHRQKSNEMEERKLMIEKGITPPPLSEYNARPERNRNPMQRALNLLAVGVGLLTGYWLADYMGMPLIFSVIAFVLLFLGLATLSAVLWTKNTKQDEE